MAVEQLPQNYALKYGEHAREASQQAGKAYAAYVTRVSELAGHARAKSQELWQSYVQAARAAAVGDDAFARTMAAYQDFQREYTKVESDYVSSVSQAYSSLTRSVADLDAKTRLKMLDDFIAYLQELRAAAANASSSESSSDRG
jgi:uncharacterized membrane protein